MFRVPLRFTLHKTLLKRRVTDLLNLRGLAQVRAVGKQGRRSLCFHKMCVWDRQSLIIDGWRRLDTKDAGRTLKECNRWFPKTGSKMT